MCDIPAPVWAPLQMHNASYEALSAEERVQQYYGYAVRVCEVLHNGKHEDVVVQSCACGLIRGAVHRNDHF